MKVKTKEVRDIVAILDDIIEDYKQNSDEKKRDWRTYEQRLAERLKKAFKELRPLVREAVSAMNIVKGETRGSKPQLTLEQKVLSLHNLHVLILKKRGVDNVDGSGDGTGYALTIKKHYASEARKLKDKIKENNGEGITDKKHMKTLFVFFFAIMDIKTRMYVCYGTILRLDRYYSAQFYVDFINQHLGKARLYFIPKTNATVKGPWEWKRMLYCFVTDPVTYLEQYFKRNQSESGISEDKKRIGWKLGQKREDRIDTANGLTTLWHNLYWLG